MSDNEVEKFEVSDYDLENEFNIHRPGRKQTKEQQIYGIWAQEEGEGEEAEEEAIEVPIPRARVLRGGLNFIPGGVQQAGKKDEKAKKKEASDEESESELAPRPMFGANADSSL